MDRSSPVSEYMRIRRHVLTLVYKNAGKSVRLPSIAELSALFNVSAPTVSKAMKALTDDGYVIGTRGIGSFTNPNIKGGLDSPLRKRLPIVGILSGDGMPVHFEVYWAKVLGRILEATTELPTIAHQVSLSSHNTDRACREIQNEQLDGLIWLAPEKNLESAVVKIAASGLPLVIVNAEIDGVSSISFDAEDAAWRCGKLLAAEKLRNVLYFPDAPPWDVEANGLRRAYREAGLTLNEKLFLKDAYSLQDRLKELFDLGVQIDAIFGQLMYRNEVEELLLELDPQIFNSCMLVNAGLSLPSVNKFRKISYEYPFDELAKAVASKMQEKLNGSKERTCKKIKLNLRFEGFSKQSANASACVQTEGKKALA